MLLEQTMLKARTLTFIACAFTVMLYGCGGGSPFVGFWACATSKSTTLEIRRFEDYYSITATHAGKSISREGIFEGDVFSVGNNHLGQPMSFELTADGLICTKPPNFCRCEAAFEKATQVSSEKSTAAARPQQASAPQVPSAQYLGQILSANAPVEFDLVNGGRVTLFDHVLNEEFEKRMFDWPKLTYFYLPTLVLQKSTNGEIVALDKNEQGIFVLLTLARPRIDVYELMEKIHEGVNTKIVASGVSPFVTDSVQVAIAGNEGTTRVEFPKNPGVIDLVIPVVKNGASPSELEELGLALVAQINTNKILPSVLFSASQQSLSDALAGTKPQTAERQWQVVY
ncbi:MAG: hypothetical protein AAF387_10805 [Pseudomonadota bacterium]